MKTVFAVLGALALVFALLFAGSALGLFQLKFWGPRYESARRQVWEETPSFVHGKRQYLSRLHHEWQMSESPTHRDAICATARHEASTLKPEYLPVNLRQWECAQ